MSNNVEQALIFFGCLVVAVILHEISHGVVALWFGDRTAKEAGRLTLNPVPHIDPFGSLVLPAMGAILGVPVIAWAKPVPVNPNRMRNPRRDMLLREPGRAHDQLHPHGARRRRARAAFDPSTVPFSFGIADLPLGVQILFSFALVNLFLGLFNLLPIPPLDGSALIERVLPGQWLPHWNRFRPYGIPRAVPAGVLDRHHQRVPAAVRGSPDQLRVPVSARKLRHLTVRFFGALRPGPPRADDVDWAHSVLGPDAFALWQRQPNHDRRHAIAVARGVQAELAGTPYADDPVWLSCALLHDIGKLDARLGVYGRVVATVAGAAAGRDMADAWSAGRLHPPRRSLPAPSGDRRRPDPARGRAGSRGTLGGRTPLRAQARRSRDPRRRRGRARHLRQRLSSAPTPGLAQASSSSAPAGLKKRSSRNSAGTIDSQLNSASDAST